MLTPEQIEAIKGELMSLKPEEQKKKFAEILSKLSEEEKEQLVGKQQCPFCLMAEGKIPVKKVYEDDKVLAILDINPANKGHTLLFPKNHAKIMPEVPEEVAKHCFSVANKISKALVDSIGAEGTNIFLANGSVAGQTAPHVLIHIIPRHKGDKVSMEWEGHKEEDKEMETTAEAIRKKIPKEKLKEEKKKVSVMEDHPRIP
jgi:histidine triad (HIT) family protein